MAYGTHYPEHLGVDLQVGCGEQMEAGTEFIKLLSKIQEPGFDFVVTKLLCA